MLQSLTPILSNHPRSEAAVYTAIGIFLTMQTCIFWIFAKFMDKVPRGLSEQNDGAGTALIPVGFEQRVAPLMLYRRAPPENVSADPHFPMERSDPHPIHPMDTSASEFDAFINENAFMQQPPPSLNPSSLIVEVDENLKETFQTKGNSKWSRKVIVF